MTDLTVQEIVDALKATTDFHTFRQCLMHEMGETTKQDEAEHRRNLNRAARIRDKKVKAWVFTPARDKASFIEDEFEEWRT